MYNMSSPGEIAGIIIAASAVIVAVFKIGYERGVWKQKQHTRDIIEIKSFLHNHIQLTHALHKSTKKLLTPSNISKNNICHFILNYIKVYNNINEMLIKYELFQKYMEHDYKSLNNSLKKMINYEDLHFNEEIISIVNELFKKNDFDIDILKSLKELTEIDSYILKIKENQTFFNSNLENLLDIIEHKYSILEKYNEFIIKIPKINQIELEIK